MGNCVLRELAIKLLQLFVKRGPGLMKILRLFMFLDYGILAWDTLIY